MAMVECLYCGGKISDKARKCVHCGTVFMEEKICGECGAALEEGAAICSVCGCPAGAYDDAVDADFLLEDDMGVNRKSHKVWKGIVAGAIVLLSVLSVCVVGINLYDRKIAEEEARQIALKKEAEQEALRRSQEYSENLLLVTDTMLSGAADAENCCNLIVQVWSNAIWEKEDSETDSYTKPDGYFVEDFNEALDNLFLDSNFQTQINEIKENQEKVNSIVGRLKNPPEEYKTAYASLAECYDVYWTFTNMAINPTDSLQTFSDNFSEIDEEFMHCYQMMKFYLQN